MLIAKACTRCKGDLLIEEEGPYRDLVCLQCGYRPRHGALLATRILARIRAAREAAAPQPTPIRPHWDSGLRKAS